MERLLHYVWKHRLLPTNPLETTDGRKVEILDPGMHNSNQGPDFFNAKILVDGVMWAGNVEIHLCSTDWYRHGHHTDPVYDNTILHVVEKADCQVTTSSGRSVPQVCLPIPSRLLEDYHTLLQTDEFPRCFRILPGLTPMRVHSWMDRLLADRMQERSGQVLRRLKAFGGDWERASFVTLCRNFGFGLNGDVFERWATSIPLQAAGKHRDHLYQLEALFLGMAGLIDKAYSSREESKTLTGAESLATSENGVVSAEKEELLRTKQEFDFLAKKFSLTPMLQVADWKYLRTRPQNFPHVRIRQIARLYYGGQLQMDALLAITDIRQLYGRLQNTGLSESSARLIAINTVVPLLYAYGSSLGREDLTDRALTLLEQLPAENNRILRTWRECGIRVKTAADSQALIQLKSVYCDRLDCLRCQFGYDYLRTSVGNAT